jgi:hypothetical protein
VIEVSLINKDKSISNYEKGEGGGGGGGGGWLFDCMRSQENKTLFMVLKHKLRIIIYLHNEDKHCT